MNFLLNMEFWLALSTLTVLEIVLGVDNIIFLALLVQHLPRKLAERARLIGVSLAFILRVVLLLGLAWMMGLDADVLVLFGKGFSGKDLLLLIGGLFLVVKGVLGIQECFAPAKEVQAQSFSKSFLGTVLQAIFIDFVFSFDSIITAIGVTRQVPVIIVAMVIAMVFMFYTSGMVSKFIHDYPSLKMLALAFIMLIGVFLVAEGFKYYIDHGYIYFAMAFSLGVEVLNIQRARKKKKNQHLDITS